MNKRNRKISSPKIPMIFEAIFAALAIFWFVAAFAIPIFFLLNNSV